MDEWLVLVSCEVYFRAATKKREALKGLLHLSDDESRHSENQMRKSASVAFLKVKKYNGEKKMESQ